MKDTLKGVGPGVGGVAAAAASALCCVGPLLAVTLGISGAGFAARFEPLRPYFLGSTAVFLVLGFWLLHREEQNACIPGKPCADEKSRRRTKIILWVATGLSVIFATYPRWQTLIL